MNVLPTCSRASAHHTLPFRSIPRRSLRSLQPQQLRPLSSTISALAQPIELTSSTTPASPAESSSITSDILSRASTDPPTTTTTTTTTTTPPPSSPSQPDPKSPFLLVGTITRTGLMSKTVHLTTQRQVFDKFLQKHYTRPSRVLAHDPHGPGYLREGDVVEYGLFSDGEKALQEEKRQAIEKTLVERGVIRLRTRKGKERDLKTVGVKKRNVRWVVRRVVTPFGVEVAERKSQVQSGGDGNPVKKVVGGTKGRKALRDVAAAV